MDIQPLKLAKEKNTERKIARNENVEKDVLQSMSMLYLYYRVSRKSPRKVYLNISYTIQTIYISFFIIL